jgi:tRNA(adenine34) deaminase
MREALKEAQKALSLDEVPVGAVVVAGDRIIARAHNLTQRLNDVTAHAEMQCITAAANGIGGKYLTDCTIYITLEPCVMCAGALAWSQVSRMVFGARDTKKGFTLVDHTLLHPKTAVMHGVLADECEKILKDFFSRKRH